MKKQNTQTKIQSVFPLLVVICGLAQGCNPNAGGSSGSASTPVSGQENQICSVAMADQPSFFEDVDSATSDPANEPEHALRNRHVKVNVESLKTALETAKGPLRMDLFNDKQLNVQVEQVEKISDKNVVMTGHLNNDLQNTVTMVVRDDVVVANFHKDDSRYEIQYRGNGTHSIHEFSAEGSEDCLTAEPPEPRVDEPIDSGAAVGKPVIDMLVAYTPAAKTQVGGLTAIKALIQMGIADTNRAFQSSGVNLSARLVGTMQVSRNDTNNFSADLSRLANRGDGFWDEVHAERARLGADQVTMVGVYPNNGVNGIGYIKASASSAFTVVKTSAFGAYSFSHELGHNVGLNHSDGMQSASGRFRTIMAYGSYPRIPRFSNPNLTYNGYTTGASNHNSARLLNTYGSYAANLVGARVPMSAGDVIYTPPKNSCQQ
jgi:hypothetical protein